VLRVASIEDAPQVARLVNLAFAVEAFFKTGDRTDADQIRDMMCRGEFLLLEDPPGTLAGCVYVTLHSDRGYFGMLSIDPARQGGGLGRRLVAAAERRCLDAGCRHMDIHIVNLREELPPFYRRLGYAENGTLPFPDADQTSRPCHFIVMTKALS
jgi:N-acetylglutamate synthase-like GNAT family acetyltransferase